MTVAVVEADRVGAGVTGHTTAKLSSLHGLTYARLSSSFGEDGARVYGEANQAGIEQIAQWVEEEAIECDFRRKPNYTYVDLARRPRRHREGGRGGTARRAARLLHRGDRPALPDRRRGAVRGPGGVPSAPVPARAGRADPGRRQPRLRGDEGDRGLRRAARAASTTTGATLTAGQVVVATHFPILDRGLYFARIHPERSYALGVRVRGATPQGMYISAEQPTRSIRSHPVDDGEILIVGGEGHKTGQGGDTLAALPGARAVRPRALGRREHRVPVGEPGQRDGRPRPVHREVRAACRIGSTRRPASGSGAWRRASPRR